MPKLFALFALIMSTGILVAADADDFYSKYNKAYHSSVSKADKELADAKEKRDKDVLSVTKKYQKALEKILTMYTKEGKLDKALKVREEIKVLEKLVDEGKSAEVKFEKKLNSDTVKADTNIAAEAKVSVSSEYSNDFLKENAIDDTTVTQWVARNENIGAWIKLKWLSHRKKKISKIVLCDRPNPTEWIQDAIITFSDGSNLQSGALPNNGSPKEIILPEAKYINWLKIEITKGQGPNIGLTEVKVFGQ